MLPRGDASKRLEASGECLDRNWEVFMQLYLDVRGSREEQFRRYPLVTGRTWSAGRKAPPDGPLVNGLNLRIRGPLFATVDYFLLDNNPAISRYHFEAGLDETGGWIRDPHYSANGTYLNGVRISSKKCPLRPGDRIQVCDCLVLVAAGASIDPKWLSWSAGVVVQLARTIAGKGQFDTLPILADALEEAGCIDADILNHCRQTGDNHCCRTDEHARGCWVIDLLLGKE
jgi:pSer/pThr/pTyr-binding forkhead associated (FHA) protein